MHPNARLIESLYSAIGDGNPVAAAACYAADAHFQDIAFRVGGREAICQMWRFVCHVKTIVTFDSVAADDRQGTGHWTARYIFSQTGRPVMNDIHSRFAFRDRLIVDHHDGCDASTWANQAYPFPLNLLGCIGPLRRVAARLALRTYVRKYPRTLI